MLRTVCKTKITKCIVTGKVMHYSGSIGIDKEIMESADIISGEQVHVLNLNNGERLITYAIEEERNSGKIVIYGPAARKGEPDDELVILSYCILNEEECKRYKQKLITLSDKNTL
ncbi:MAG: aspartate 1-decarboxylase [Candidatus Omnitrophica bacterium]|nr:aspartate 1-decarboxylase [Candidatus Omnitrophota bacterium]